MKTESEMRDRVQFLLLEELDRRVAEASERLPCRCVNNYQHPLDQNKTVEGRRNDRYNRITDSTGLPVLRTIGLCMLGSEDPTQWGGTICEEPLDAKRCPVFTPSQTKEQLLSLYEEQLRDTEWVKVVLPEVFTLLWALGELVTPKLPWWKRVWFWFLRIRIEPVHPSIDASKLLPPSS